MQNTSEYIKNIVISHQGTKTMQCDTTITHKNAEVKKDENNQVGRDIDRIGTLTCY